MIRWYIMRYSSKKTNAAFYISLLILILSAILAGYTYFQFLRFEHEGNIINTAGRIRGSIQRIARKEALLENPDQEDYDIINNYLAGFKDKEAQLRLNEKTDIFYNLLERLERSWIKLQTEAHKYRENNNKNNRLNLIFASEECWEISNELVLTTQKAYEKKIISFKIISGVLSAITLGLITVVWFIRYYVRKRLEYAVSHDTLTRILNRHSFNIYLETEIARYKRYNTNLSLVIFDIDKFKNINDAYGHKAGDSVLHSVSRTVSKVIRSTDLFFRIGGEEFAIIAPGTSLKESVYLSEKIREAVQNIRCIHKIKVTISVGTAQATRKETSETLFEKADQAMYKAKESGRNQVATNADTSNL
ncbi:MAG: GGDEF domain-containing protein [Spirochaetes bacterium]|nr:GGDEF domain-containing protein [Spirochaetota bacterium]MBN2772013.1 GGDEF domain-containing protein [Spirochaetota bacterium]